MKTNAVKALWDYWKELHLACGGVPSKRAFQPMALKRHLANIYVLERREGVWFNRILGTNVIDDFGSNPADQPAVLSYYAGDTARLIQATLDFRYRMPAGSVSVAAFWTGARRWRLWEYMALPVQPDGTNGPQLYVASEALDVLELTDTPLPVPIERRVLSMSVFSPTGRALSLADATEEERTVMEYLVGRVCFAGSLDAFEQAAMDQTAITMPDHLRAQDIC